MIIMNNFYYLVLVGINIMFTDITRAAGIDLL
jgi:hypothetical protein